jgi:predicted kinase
METVDAPTDLAPDRGLHSLHRRLDQLSDRHPSSPRYGQDNRTPDARPLSDEEHAEHVAFVRTRLDEAHRADLATDIEHTVDEWREVWSDERAAMHDDLVDDLYARHESVPCDGKAILAGGLPGAGKTTVLHEHARIDLSQYMMINPDDIKAELASRGLVPEVDGLSPMEASDLVHEESSYLAKRLANRAEAECRNVIWDITMSRASSANDRLDSLRAAGYAHVEAVFVDIPIDVSARRAESRHREGHDLYREGRALGGRFIPGETILSHSDPEWGSQNRRNFETVKSRFDAWYRFDNSVDGRDPVLVEESGPAGLSMGGDANERQ